MGKFTSGGPSTYTIFLIRNVGSVQKYLVIIFYYTNADHCVHLWTPWVTLWLVRPEEVLAGPLALSLLKRLMVVQ